MSAFVFHTVCASHAHLDFCFKSCSAELTSIWWNNQCISMVSFLSNLCPKLHKWLYFAFTLSVAINKLKQYWSVVCLCYFPTNFQVLVYPWMDSTSPTTALWPSQILELVLQLWCALLSIHPAVILQTQKLSGTFPMEVKSQTIQTYHTKELEQSILGEWFSTATLRVPQQEFSTVTYLLPVVAHRASMWGYMIATLVSPELVIVKEASSTTDTMPITAD